MDVKCGDAGEFRFAPYPTPGKNIIFGPGATTIPVVLSNKLPKFRPTRSVADLYQTSQFVRHMSHVQLKTVVMWDGTGALLQCPESQHGTAGVLVSDAR